MKEFKIQVSYDNGKVWIEANNQPYNNLDFEYVKDVVNRRRKINPNYQYRIIGREVMPWCEIKESDVK